MKKCEHIGIRGKYNRIWLLYLMLIQMPYVSTGQSDSELIRSLDQYIESARIQWKTPGLAVAVVKEGEVLLSKGFGEREINSGAKVTDQTIFSIGSTTKAMTAAAVAMLVDEGKLTWDDEVVDHLTWFELKDPFVTRELKIRDLFTHNAGLGNTDLLWALWDYSTEEAVRRLSQVDPTYSFRGGYTYQNLMYATAGLLIEELSGQSWSEFIRMRILEPLGMNRTFPLRSQAFEYDNRSVPHYFFDGEVQPIADSNADSIGAAGSIWSCTEDMVKWMNFVLDSALVDGERLISESSFRELHKPHVIVPLSQFYPTARLTQPHWTTYALGWFQHDYHGEFVHFHTGSLSGTVAIIGLIPDRDLGVYVFGNLDHTEVRHAIMYKVFDLFTGQEDRDWSTEFLNLYDGMNQTAQQNLDARTRDRLSDTNPSLELPEYAGVYADPFLGKLQIESSEAGLKIIFRTDRTMALEHWHNDTFLGRFDQLPFDNGNLVDFDLSASNELELNLFGRTFKKVK